MKKNVCIIVLIFATLSVVSQNTINQNGIQSTVTEVLSADALQAKRYKVATVLYNSHHWQNSSIIQVELFNTRYSSGYEKYIIELGYGQGTGSSSPKVALVESRGTARNARVVLGTPIGHSTSAGGYPNKTISIYADIRYYSSYKAKITHLRDKVTSFSDRDQIIINESPTTREDIEDFQAPTAEKSTDTWGKTGNDINYTNGNVGIGISNPRSRLDIGTSVGANKGLRIGDYIELNERETINNAGVIGFNAHIDSNDVSKFKPTYAGKTIASGMVMAMKDGGVSDLTFYGYNWGTDATPRSLSEFTKVLHLSTSGKVGIGTADTKGFELGVNGKIAATEVKIAIYDNWADFVFKDDYKLPTLTAVENHIKEKGHLKDIPSAAEVKKDGFFLGEMDAKLLQKIEELTLYTIQQDKQLKKQVEELRELKELVNKLIKKSK